MARMLLNDDVLDWSVLGDFETAQSLQCSHALLQLYIDQTDILHHNSRLPGTDIYNIECLPHHRLPGRIPAAGKQFHRAPSPSGISTTQIRKTSGPCGARPAGLW